MGDRDAPFSDGDTISPEEVKLHDEIFNQPPISKRHIDLQLRDRPLRYPLPGRTNNPLAAGVDSYWMNTVGNPPWQPSYYPEPRAELDLPEPIAPSHAQIPGRESSNVQDLRHLPPFAQWAMQHTLGGDLRPGVMHGKKRQSPFGP